MIVHNGIIENYRELRKELEAWGIVSIQKQIRSDCTYGNRIFKHDNTPENAVYKTLQRLEGAYAVAFLFTDFDDVMFGARHGSPLAIGFGDGEMFLGSDAMASDDKSCDYLDDGDWCVLTRDNCIIKDMNDAVVDRPIKTVNLFVLAEKEGYRHFMLKEIYEQPTAISQTLSVHSRWW